MLKQLRKKIPGSHKKENDGELKKTGVFVTDDVAFLKEADNIICMEKGKVIQQGTWATLKNSKIPIVCEINRAFKAISCEKLYKIPGTPAGLDSEKDNDRFWVQENRYNRILVSEKKSFQKETRSNDRAYKLLRRNYNTFGEEFGYTAIPHHKKRSTKSSNQSQKGNFLSADFISETKFDHILEKY